MKFRNLTPHAVCLANGNLRITLEKNPMDPVVRIEENVIRTMVDYEIAPGVTASLQLEAHTGYTVVNLPDPEPGVMYIVSSMVASRVRRADVVSPVTDATCERDESGRVISVRGFQTYTPDYRKKASAADTFASASTPVFEETAAAVASEPFIESPELEAALEAIQKEEAEAIEELMEEILPAREILVASAPVPKFDIEMLDPIKAAARAKYEKRMARATKRKK